jgi:hypothetical protein
MACDTMIRPFEPMLGASGRFAEPVDVPDGADAQVRLLALVGRQT